MGSRLVRLQWLGFVVYTVYLRDQDVDTPLRTTSRHILHINTVYKPKS